MADDITIPIASLGGIGVLITTVIGWFLRSHNERIKKIESDNKERLQKMEDDNKANAAAAALVATNLATFQLEAEKRFAKEETMQASLARIHDRLDVTATKDEVKEIRDDIKKLLVKAGVA
jgi:hypothetical protein